MYDVYLMSKETGEIVPATQVIREFYNTHPWNADWRDEWVETDILTDTLIAPPDFAACVAI